MNAIMVTMRTYRAMFFFLWACSFCLSMVSAQQMPKREMRGVWIATVENIDWPSSSALSADKQKAEIISLLEHIVSYNLNTVVFQVRPAADAFYASEFEPWSQWLTGEQGQAPEPFYDPLKFIIDECRKRGLDIHAWINPYRAVRDTGRNLTHPEHITNRRPEWFITYGQTMYFNPALPEVRDYVSRIVSDIVRRYDIDAIHMDDYFYPYRISGQNFPDDHDFSMFGGSYPANRRDDWRRHNTDLIIQQIADSIKSIKPWVEFGISPFGVWRNSSHDSTGSATKAGQTNYDDLFADILKWQKNGWIDYVAPQLYWHIGFTAADYAVLAEWWDNNTYGCPLYIGQALYRLDKKSAVKSWQSSEELTRQIMLNREYRNIKGSMFFSAKYLRTNPLKLRQNMLKVYPCKSLPHVNPRVKAEMPEPPGKAVVEISRDSILLRWNANERVKQYVVYRFRIGEKADRSDAQKICLITADTSVVLPRNCKNSLRRHYYCLTSISRSNIESGPVYFRRAASAVGAALW